MGIGGKREGEGKSAIEEVVNYYKECDFSQKYAIMIAHSCNPKR